MCYVPRIDLPRALIVGDIDAFETVVERHQHGIRSFIAMLSVPADSIDEVAQQAFIEAFRAIGRFDPQLDLGKWLRGIARNCVKRYFSSLSRRRTVHLEGVMTQLCDDPDPDALADLAEDLLPRLQHCLEALPERARSIVDSYYWKGQTTAEIANNLDASHVSIRVGLSRLRTSLRSCVEGKICMNTLNNKRQLRDDIEQVLVQDATEPIDQTMVNRLQENLESSPEAKALVQEQLLFDYALRQLSQAKKNITSSVARHRAALTSLVALHNVFVKMSSLQSKKFTVTENNQTKLQLSARG